jgi:hypothetical protein
MEHLSAETLARLVDEAPSVDEAGHLKACPACVQQIEELREQTDALGALPDLRPPPGDWEVLQAKLVSEGLVRSGSRLGRGLGLASGWMQVAAAVILFVGGAMVGGVAIQSPTVANFTGILPSPAEFSAVTEVNSADEAAEWVRRAERQYVEALLQWRRLSGLEDGTSSSPDPAERYAALEYLVRAGQAALRTAPADPFLNGLVASAVDERDAVLRQISTTEGDSNWY